MPVDCKRGIMKNESIFLCRCLLMVMMEVMVVVVLLGIILIVALTDPRVDVTFSRLGLPGVWIRG